VTPEAPAQLRAKACAGDYQLSPGQTEIGWVNFELPDSVKVASIQWQIDDGLNGGSPATWTVG